MHSLISVSFRKKYFFARFKSLLICTLKNCQFVKKICTVNLSYNDNGYPRNELTLKCTKYIAEYLILNDKLL